MGTPERSVLVTGGAGLIGKVIAEHLGGRWALTCVDRLPGPAGVRSHVADLAELRPADLAGLMEGHDAVVHLAADPAPEASWESLLPNNFVLTRNLFEGARLAGVRRVVFASSNHASGGFYTVDPWRAVIEGRLDGLAPGAYPLVDEDHPVRPDSLYGVSKAFGEAVGSYYADYHGITSVHLRIGWVRADDDPGGDSFARAIWLSQRDAAQIVRLAVAAPDALRHGVFFATSDNRWKVFSIERARQVLGYEPRDGAG